MIVSLILCPSAWITQAETTQRGTGATFLLVYFYLASVQKTTEHRRENNSRFCSPWSELAILCSQLPPVSLNLIHIKMLEILPWEWKKFKNDEWEKMKQESGSRDLQ